MRTFGLYTILSGGFLGGLLVAWIALCCRAAKHSRDLVQSYRALLERLEARIHSFEGRDNESKIY